MSGNSPDILTQIWNWFWASLTTIADLIILAGAIVGGIAYLVRRFYFKPDLKFEVILETNGFGWNIRNNGHTRCYELAVGTRVVEANYSELNVSNLSLGHGHDVNIGFLYRKGTDPPVFRFVIGEHPFVEGINVRVRREQDLSLVWGRLYNLEVEYSYKDSDTYIRRYRIQLGATPQTPIKSMTVIAG